MALKNKKMILTLVGLASLILQVVAISTEKWAELAGSQSGISGNYNWGLWKSCTSGANIDISLESCKSMDGGSKKASLDAARAFSILGSLGVLLGISSLYMYPNRKMLSPVLFLSGAIATFIGIIIFATELLNMPVGKGHPGYSFYLSVASGVFALGAAFVSWRMK